MEAAAGMKPLTGAAEFKRLCDLLAPEPEKVPAGFLTCQQWRDRWGCCKTKTLDLIRAGLKRGKIESRQFRVRSGSYVRTVLHYRLL